ncbi:MAG TPA: hypothetical protein VIY72_17275 [Acidimicrobiales bacterium]
MPMLPDAFADLEPFAPTWCLKDEPDRYATRLASTMDEMQTFYDAFLPRLEDALSWLDRYDLDDIPDDELAQNLLWLCYSLVCVSFPVEVWRQPRVPDSGASMIHQIVAPAV